MIVLLFVLVLLLLIVIARIELTSTSTSKITSTIIVSGEQMRLKERWDEIQDLEKDLLPSGR